MGMMLLLTPTGSLQGSNEMVYMKHRVIAQGPGPLAIFCLGNLVISLQTLDSVRVIYWTCFPNPISFSHPEQGTQFLQSLKTGDQYLAGGSAWDGC